MTDTNKILWFSNGPNAPTGYGTQTRTFLHQIAADFDIDLFSFYGLEGFIGQLDVNAGEGKKRVLEYPRGRHPYGNDIVGAHFERSGADFLVSLIDPFALDPDAFEKIPWCSWVPVDCYPLQAENIHSLRASNWTWAMSRFGEKMLKAAGFNPYYVPHGIETNLFKPGDRDKARQLLSNHLEYDLTGKYLVVTVAANKGTPSRKNFAGMFDAMAELMRQHDDVVWYIHTDLNGTEPLQAFAQSSGMDTERLFFASPYNYVAGFYPPQFLNDVYNAADVFLLLSFGEGFGLPIVEAQAAGCPVIVTDFSAMSELVFAGEKVPAIPIQALDGRFGSKWGLPLLPKAVEALNRLYALRGDEQVRVAAREGAMAYDSVHVYNTYMKPALLDIAKQVQNMKAPASDSRKRRKSLEDRLNGKRAPETEKATA